jgi:hypothetical protein
MTKNRGRTGQKRTGRLAPGGVSTGTPLCAWLTRDHRDEMEEFCTPTPLSYHSRTIDAGEEAIWSRVGGADLGGFFSVRELAVLVYRAMIIRRSQSRVLAKRKNREARASHLDTI